MTLKHCADCDEWSGGQLCGICGALLIPPPATAPGEPAVAAAPSRGGPASPVDLGEGRARCWAIDAARAAALKETRVLPDRYSFESDRGMSDPFSLHDNVHIPDTPCPGVSCIPSVPGQGGVPAWDGEWVNAEASLFGDWIAQPPGSMSSSNDVVPTSPEVVETARTTGDDSSATVECELSAKAGADEVRGVFERETHGTLITSCHVYLEDGRDLREEMEPRLLAVERWAAQHAADHHDTRLVARLVTLERNHDKAIDGAIEREATILHRLAKLEAPVGPVAPLLGVHVEAMRERARIVAMLRARSDRALPEARPALRMAAHWIERGEE